MATSTTISSGGIQNVKGIDIFATIQNGGTQRVSGRTTSAAIKNGGEQYVEWGGIATSTTISSGGIQHISRGGTADGTYIYSDGVQHVSGGTAINTRIEWNGTQHISSGGTASGTVLNSSGAAQYVYAGGLAIRAIVSRGDQYIYDGGSANSTTINSGGNQHVSSGGSATETKIISGAQHVSSGGSATGTTINGFSFHYESGAGIQHVYNGGTATETTINSGGRQHVSSGGIATETTINSGGQQHVYSGGSANGTTIGGSRNNGVTSSAGWQYVSSGGSATSTTINSAGYQNVSSGASATSTTINQGGQQTLYGNANNTTISGTGFQEVIGGTAVETHINGEPESSIRVGQRLGNGAHAENTYIYENGRQSFVLIGDATAGLTTANNTYIYTGGVQSVYGNTSETGIYAGQEALATNTFIEGGTQYVEDATARNTKISKGGIQYLRAKALADITHIEDGVQYIYADAQAKNTTIKSLGSQMVYTGGTATDTTIKSGGIQWVESGGTTTDTTINGGQSWLRAGAVANGETSVNAGGELLMDAGSLATDVNISGGTLSVSDLSDATSGQNTVQVGMLTMDGGNVNFLRNSDGEFAKLTITELSGTGNFLLNTSLADRKGNFVTIEQGTGQFGIAVADSGKEISDHTDLTLNLIHEKGGDIDFEMVTASGRSTRFVDGGTYMYTLYSQQDKDGLTGGNVWYLGAMGSGGENPGGENPGGENPGGENPGGENPGGENPGGGDNGNAGGNGNGGKKPMTTPATDAILAMSNAGLNVIHSELDGLRTYRASLDKTGPESNVWGHYLGSKSDIDTSNGAAYKLSQNGLEIGADTRTDFDRGSLVTGTFMSFSDNKVKHARGGTSKIDSYGLGLYATWYDASGFYADGVVKGNRLNNKLRAVMTNGGRTGGDWTQYALSTAVEGGYQFDLKDDVSITPYARLAFVQMTSEDVKLSNGMKGNTGTPRSVTGEAGAKIAGKFNIGSTEFKPYLSAAVVQEFANSNDVTINERNRFDNNVKGTSGKYGLGASVNVGKDVTLYGEANYRQGSQIETPIQGVAGIRIGF